MDVSIGERRGLEGGMHVHKPSACFPRAQGDSALGFVCSSLNVLKVAAQGSGRGGVGAAFFKMCRALIAPIAPILRVSFQDNDFDGHGGTEELHLPGFGRPHDESGSPKLHWQLASQLPAQGVHRQAHQTHAPPGALGPRRWRKAMRLGGGVSHVQQVRPQRPSKIL